jgi:ribosomal protein S12 methylthiotransferase accessory factor
MENNNHNRAVDVNHSRIVFIGPSLSLDEAKQILPDADYRAPIKRGDLDGISPGSVIGIIDRVFAQTLAISPGEIREALDNGIDVYGAASMGALRAAEVSSVIGIGRVFEMYRTGLIDRDDEVAVLMNPDTHEALTEPLVNVRFAVERLVRSGTLNRGDGAAIVDSCMALHYTERTYQRILSTSRLARNKDIDDIIRLLKNFDLKGDDARLLLETISTVKPRPLRALGPRVQHVQRPTEKYQRVNVHEDSAAPVMVWESGDSVHFADLIRFLKVTGKFESVARNVIGRMAMAIAIAAADNSWIPSSQHNTESDSEDRTKTAQLLLDATRAQWGWNSPEEVHVTMRDLGLGFNDIASSLEAEGICRRLVRCFGAAESGEFSKAIRSELWLHDLDLKRETLRLGALQFFAHMGAISGPPFDDEVLDAQRCIARLIGVFRWRAVLCSLESLGVRPAEIAAAVQDIALARRAARPIVKAIDRNTARTGITERGTGWRTLGIGLETSLKARNSARFSQSEVDAAGMAQVIAKQMGIRRIGLIGELDTLGIYIAQAFGERSGWSSSFASGKAETRDGARIGCIMEEVEIHAQDAYTPEERIHTSYALSSSTLPMVDPRELGLPYDSRYSENLEIDWSPCLDLVSCSKVYVPSACLLRDRLPNDIMYCTRLGGKVFSSNGLGSGFSLAEAIVHAAAEYIERHARRLAELELDNPGGVGVRQFWFVDEQSLPEIPTRIVERYHRAGMCVRILDITSEIAIPTFYVRIFEDLFKTDRLVSAGGFACHPDPEVAVTMALLEAAQTRGGYIAGGREDYSLHVRSLGRHERPLTAVPQSQIFWFSNDRQVRPLQETVGFRSNDILKELEWMVDRVTAAELPMFLVADYSIPRIHPANAVRVLIPGLETTNQFFTGPRARATIIRDLLPR